MGQALGQVGHVAGRISMDKRIGDPHDRLMLVVHQIALEGNYVVPAPPTYMVAAAPPTTTQIEVQLRPPKIKARSTHPGVQWLLGIGALTFCVAGAWFLVRG